ncbi:protein HEXIM1 [Melitaea cinxia]|uniref:protein HEXIM1 n=1 Tax=Melitaea cinxia TaxID=113334 RepID=UPI001E2724EA|nr:protein HEXIM1 [Melitaea cinxia]
MDVNNISELKDGDSTRALVRVEAPSVLKVSNHKVDGNVKKKRRRGKTKRKVLKPFLKMSWQERRMIDNSKRNNRFRKIVLSKTQAPFNNNQFLMEIHKPEPENNFNLFRTPSARTRDSSFSVDSEENYFFSLPEDEEEYLTKEFSSVYEDAQCERLSNMSKNELVQEYLLLEAKYDNLIKRSERNKIKDTEDDKDASIADKDVSGADKSSMSTDRDTSGTSINAGSIDEPSFYDIMLRLKDQEEKIRELQLANEKLLLENSRLRQRNQGSSEDSESDSSSTSDSCSNSSCSSSPEHENVLVNGDAIANGNHILNGVDDDVVNGTEPVQPLVNGFHSPSD